MLKRKKEAKLQAIRQKLFDKDVARKNALAKKKAQSNPTVVEKKAPSVAGLRRMMKCQSTPSFITHSLTKLGIQAD